MNRRLRDQIERHFGDLAAVPPEIRPWIDDVGGTYDELDTERRELKRTLQHALADWKKLRAEMRQGAEEDHAAEAEQLAVTLRSIGDGVITASSRGEVQLMNRVAEELTGWKQEEAAGRPLDQVLSVVDRDPGSDFPRRVEEVSRETLNMSGLLLRRDGTRVAISNRMSPLHARDGRIIGVVIVFRDITEERRREDERLRASKLESVGILAGGIAHDFNNFLTAILGNIALARKRERSEKVDDLLARSETAARKARDLTQQLLTFSRGGSPVKKTASACQLIEECATFALRGSNVRCELEIDDELHAVEIDRGQVTQVLHNLIINADQAMPGGGVISIRAANVQIEAYDSRPLKAGTYVRIAVRDHGTGISAEHLEKIFDPYFTTKEKGSGLGLATSYSIARNHQGWIEVDSTPGGGTTFSVYLPAAPPGSSLDETGPREQIESSGGRVLVMDDDASVREVALEMLQFLGYEAVSAAEGQSMIEEFQRAVDAGRPYDAVIMDLTIPGGMGGSEAIGKVLAIDPGARVVVSSGYSNDPIMADYAAYGFHAVLRKPFDVEELSRALDEVRAGDS